MGSSQEDMKNGFQQLIERKSMDTEANPNN